MTHCQRKTNLHRINERKNDLPLKSNEPLEKFCLLTAKTQEDILGCGCSNKMSPSVFDDILRMTAIMICSKYQLFQSRIFVCLQLFQFSTVITLKVQCCYVNVKNGYLRRVRYLMKYSRMRAALLNWPTRNSSHVISRNVLVKSGFDI